MEEEISVPAVRVRVSPADSDETFDGTVIEERKYLYVIIPDYDTASIQNWNKNRCTVLR